MIRILLGLLFLQVAAFAEETPTTAYAQLSSIKTQIPASKSPIPVIMDSVDKLYNFEVSAKRDKLTARVGGTYFLIASGQCGSINRNDVGFIDLWFVKNEAPIPNSNSRMSVDNSTLISVLITQFLIQLAPGDTIGTNFFASGPSLGFIFTKPDNEPANTSFLFSIFKID